MWKQMWKQVWTQMWKRPSKPPSKPPSSQGESMGPSDAPRSESWHDRPARIPGGQGADVSDPHKPPPGPGGEGEKDVRLQISQTRQQAQVEMVLQAFGDDVRRGPTDDAPQYLYRADRILVRDEYVDQVLQFLPDSRRDRGLIHGVTSLSVPMDALDAVNLVRVEFGFGVVAPDHLVSITGEFGHCPATRAGGGTWLGRPDPVLATDHTAGEGIRVVVIDTGLDPAAPDTHPWMAGVTGDADLAIGAGQLGAYAGHGTFIAGVVRCLAPRAEVIVRGVFKKAGATFESTWSSRWTASSPTTSPMS